MVGVWTDKVTKTAVTNTSYWYYVRLNPNLVHNVSKAAANRARVKADEDDHLLVLLDIVSNVYNTIPPLIHVEYFWKIFGKEK